MQMSDRDLFCSSKMIGFLFLNHRYANKLDSFFRPFRRFTQYFLLLNHILATVYCKLELLISYHFLLYVSYYLSIQLKISFLYTVLGGFFRWLVSLIFPPKSGYK